MDNKENSISKQPGSSDSVHSVHSQDTELIDEAASPFDGTLNASIISTPGRSDSLRVHTGSPQDHSLIDFISSPNQTSSTACSTPHESKLASLSKRRCTSSSEEQLTIKKLKLMKDSLDNNIHRFQKDASTNRSLDSESSHEELSSLLNQKRLLPLFKQPIVESAEASSSSSSEKLISSSSIECEDPTMVKKQRSPDYLRQRNSSRKALLEEYDCSGDHSSLEARLSYHQNEVRTLQSILKNKRKSNGNDRRKEQRGKTMTERVLCSVSYVYDNIAEEITSISIKQMSKTDLYFDLKQPRLSLSSGSLADSSGSETNWVSKQPSSVFINHSSSTVSSSSSGPSHLDKLPINKFRIPPIPDQKKHMNFKYPDTCVCQCFCSSFVDILAKPRCFTPETSSSSSETFPQKIDSQDLTLNNHHMADLVNNRVQQSEKNENPSVENSMNDCQVFSSRSSIYIPATKNLPVFAKWPSNSYCYPGIVENATEDTWHKSSHLEVKFCDGTVKKILSDNLFPAYLLPSGSEISFEKDDICESAVLISIERLLNNELVCLGESQKGIGERVNIPFEKIFLTDYCYKGLKKEMTDSITPRKTPKFSICEANVQEGKRTRKAVKFESISPKQSGSTGRKTRAKSKRARSAGTTSSSDTSKDTGGKKRSRSSSHKKQLKKSEDESTTPHVQYEGKKEVSRKLYSDSPGCSTTKQKEAFEILEIIPSTDTDSSIMRDVNIDEVSDHNLDSELIPDISQRSTKTKASLRRNNTGSSDDTNKGPIPEKSIFSGFNFVLTHAAPKKNISVAREAPVSSESFSEEGDGTDYEDYFQCSVPFDFLRLREQIMYGGGRVYRSILLIPVEEHKKTFLITDNIVETPNYLLAVSLGIPVYRHDLIVDCCIQGRNISEMCRDGMKMPYGRSLLTGSWVESKSSEKPFKGYTCALCLTGNESTLSFWWHILTNAGARVISNQNISRLIAEFDDQISFIVADKKAVMKFLESTESCNIPVLSTTWVIQCIIRGEQVLHTSHSQFKITLDDYS